MKIIHEFTNSTNYTNFKNLKIALVHEFLNQFGGAERILLALKEIFPNAPIYALLADFNKLPKEFKGLDIRTSFLQKWPSFLRKKHKLLLSFYPLAIEQFDLSSYDLIISDSNSFAKGVLTKAGAIHICYCHTPPPYLWHYTHEYLKEQNLSNISRVVVLKMLNRLRIWDYQAAQRVDYFIANSKNVQKRIKQYYNRDSEVIYPPVNINNLRLKTQNSKPQPKVENYFERQREKRFPSGARGSYQRALRATRFLSEAKGSYFLIVSRLSPYKKIDLAVEAFNKLKEKLIIIGQGSELKRLRKIANPNIQFLGSLSDKEIIKHYQNCKALIFPGEEDFGIVPVEAMSFGKPVIAFKKGGLLESVIENKTGVFFKEPTALSLLDAITDFTKIENKFNSNLIKSQAKKFHKKIFQKKIKEFIKRVVHEKG